ncbi:MAG: helix-turn-helix domain-containing protein [Rhodobacteraceae bacterium]|nr:helix-turn-helix domain-containing protein [Paracoccaceae bacterium]
MTGGDLRRARLERGWSQRELARRAGLTHKAVQYWEAKPEVDPRAHAFKAIAAAFGWDAGEFPAYNARARGGLLVSGGAERVLAAFVSPPSAHIRENRSCRRVVCGAKTRRGTPCRAKSEPGRRRCRFHGGKSTGPRTPEGKARVAEAQRRRWALWRHERGDG